MSHPFRSPVDQLQEQLRRAQERIGELETERTRLREELGPGRSHTWRLAMTLTWGIVSCGVGYLTAAVPATTMHANMAAAEARGREELGATKEALSACIDARVDVHRNAPRERVRRARSAPAP